ncbi:Acetyl-CoA:oxalate CoA-transferase [Pseudomonas sp. AD21]|uniref:CaiB/BaiF CoA transferase family protein n=1 Tax=Pseudomonas sp. AD21 TaxID=396378 RepID=UPI000C834C94|nr:CoA transferase [Pseudomonas sp. AD21]PMQ11589.1 Acetyl-CoA:oxalate CoA-transferase [Pseudomonas sp. AD21]
MKPLEGLKIVSIEHFAAGPYGSMHLADLGATVIKIENVKSDGDPARRMGPYFIGDNDSLVFQGWNTCKQSIALDLKKPEDWCAFESVVRSADAVMNNLRGDQPAKLGLDYDRLKHLNKSIVCLHISAYGRNNSRAAWPGYDYLMQAEAGLMHLTGDPSADPTRFGVSIIDFMTGTMGVMGLLAGIIKAKASGEGSDVDISLFDVALHQLGYVGTWYLNEGLESSRVPRGSHMSISPVQTFTTADGWIYVMCMTEQFWQLLLNKLDRQDLATDPRFSDQNQRSRNRDALTEVLDQEFACSPTQHWLSLFEGILPIAPICTVKEALDNPFVEEVEMISEVPHPMLPTLRLLANPLRFNGVRPRQRVGSALGADNRSVFPREKLTVGDDIPT